MKQILFTMLSMSALRAFAQEDKVSFALYDGIFIGGYVDHYQNLKNQILLMKTEVNFTAHNIQFCGSGGRRKASVITCNSISLLYQLKFIYEVFE